MLFFLSGFFSCSEAALFSLTPLHLHKMKEERSPVLSHVNRLLEYPRRLLITILVSNESVNITISVLVTSLCIHYFGVDGQWLAVAVTTPMLLIFAEAVPKTFAVIRPISFSLLVSPPLILISKIERPVVWTLEKISWFFVSMFSDKTARGKRLLRKMNLRPSLMSIKKKGDWKKRSGTSFTRSLAWLTSRFQRS